MTSGAALNLAQCSSLKAEVLRRDEVGSRLAVSNFRYLTLARYRDLIEPIATMDHKRPCTTQVAKHLREYFGQLGSINPNNLGVGSRWVRKRSQQVEYRTNAHLSPHQRDIPHCFVKQRRMQKPYANLVNTTGNTLRRKLDLNAESFDD